MTDQSKKSIDPKAGLEKEIEALRSMIDAAIAQETKKMSLDARLTLMESVGKASTYLARLMKAQKELGKAKIDVGTTLEQALIELEDEWPALRKFASQFKPIKDHKTP